MDKFLDLLIPFAVIGGVGAFFGLMLGIAAKFWKVDKDERIDKILGCLPGANCGGCGYSGCGAFAEAVSRGEAPVDGCKVGGGETLECISEVMGVESGDYIPAVSCAACHGTSAETRQRFRGALDCLSVAKLGGEKKCPYSCIGLGSCVEVCKFFAISIVDGVAVVDNEKCTACGACVRCCPKKLFRIHPKGSVFVGCSSHDDGKHVREYCENGCIGCRICEKVCEYGAIRVENNLAVIDYDKCTGCGKCAEKCPKNIIRRA